MRPINSQNTPVFLTRYGSEVAIVGSNKDYAAMGIFLVQAEVIVTGRKAPPNHEVQGQLVGQNDPFSLGFIPLTALVSPTGNAKELLNTACAAPDVIPNNHQALLRLYWPTIFGSMTPDDISQAGNAPGTVLSSVRARFGSNAG